MISYVYAALLLVSIAVVIFMAGRNYNNIDIHCWSIILLIPVILLGYTIKSFTTDVETARIAMILQYLDSTIILPIVLFSMLKYLNVKAEKWVKILVYGIGFLRLIAFSLCLNTTIYYSSFSIVQTSLGTITRTTNGPGMIAYYICLWTLVGVISSVPIVCYFRKKDCSRKNIRLYSTLCLAGIIGYAVDALGVFDFSLIPFIFVWGDVTIAIRYDALHGHDMDFVIKEQKNGSTETGYISFDRQKRLLGYNEEAISFIPEMKGMRIDERIPKENEKLVSMIYPLIDLYEKEGKASNNFEIDGTIFKISVTSFSLHKGGKSSGYLLELQDVTAEQGYMNLIKEYGQSLEKDVNEKTEHIRFIQERVVLGMATIIENRDMNTGGHVRRTSDIIRIIVEEMQKQGIGDIDDGFADEIIRSAPMHDLGKISIDNEILNKKGKLTDEEYAIMKTHSAKSGEIVQAILSGVEEPHFIQTAYCLARFHHERWDGRGYPERLAEIEIPIEARIMAVADVYDALVSKRCYKEAMSFEKAAEIMIEGMGSQFDPMMKPIFEACREQLEAYYTLHKEE